MMHMETQAASKQAAPKVSGLFKRAEKSAAFLKMGIYGDAGSGKTRTASEVAIGLALHLKAMGQPLPPVLFIDTETGAHWVRPLFESKGIEFLTAQTRAFSDLKTAVADAEAMGAILIVDSITHFWEEVKDTFLKAKRERLRRSYLKLEFSDYGTLKPLWGEFTTAYLNSRAHIILCGRAGGTYEYQENDESHKKDLIQTGTKMRTEKDMGYEPSLLVEMTIEKDPADKRKKKTFRRAFIIKDRSDILDGTEVDNPEFKDFLPHIKWLNLGGVHKGFDADRNSAALFPADDREDRSFQRKVVLEEIENLLVLHFPSTGGSDRKAKIEHLRDFFHAPWAELDRMPLEELRANYDALHRKLEDQPSRYARMIPAPVDDEIPDFGSTGIPALEALRVRNGERPEGSAEVRDEGAIFAAEQRGAKDYAAGARQVPAEYRIKGNEALLSAYGAGFDRAKAAAESKITTPSTASACPAPGKADQEPPAPGTPPSVDAGGSPSPTPAQKAYADGRADARRKIPASSVPAQYAGDPELAAQWRNGHAHESAAIRSGKGKSHG